MKLPRRRFLHWPLVLPRLRPSQEKINVYSNFIASRTDHDGFLPGELLPGKLCAARRQIGTDHHGGFFPSELLFGELSAARRQFGTGYSNESEGTVVCPAGRSR